MDVRGPFRILQLKVGVFSQKLAENAKGLKLRPEGFGEELVKIGFILEGAYGTPGQGGTCPIFYFQTRKTLTTKQVLNVPCMLIANRHEHGCAARNQFSSDSNSNLRRHNIRKDDNRKVGSKFSPTRNFQLYITYVAPKPRPSPLPRPRQSRPSTQNLNGLDR